MAEFCGKWELESTDSNFEKYMEVTGVSAENRKLAKDALCGKLYHEISRDGSTWKVKVITPKGEKLFEYPEGESVDSVTLDGRQIKVVYTVEGGKLVETQTGSGFTSRNVRALDGDKLTMTFSSGDVSAVRTYKKV